jgi:hypothetical protein
MFESVSQVAEALATGMSRRSFLDSIGRWAGATALAMAGALTTAGTVQAGAKYKCCTYYNPYFNGDTGGQICCGTACVPLGASCPPPPSSCSGIVDGPTTKQVSGCGGCKC